MITYADHGGNLNNGLADVCATGAAGADVTVVSCFGFGRCLATIINFKCQSKKIGIICPAITGLIKKIMRNALAFYTIFMNLAEKR
jgi:hypothetical protein